MRRRGRGRDGRSWWAWLVPSPVSLGAVAWCWGAYIGGVVVQSAAGPPPAQGPGGPPAGHPERLAPELPVTDEERHLWQQLGYVT